MNASANGTPRFSLLRLCAFLLCTVTAPGAAIAGDGDELRFSALDADWRAYNFTWTEVEQQWLAGVTVEVVAAGDRGVTAPQMMSAFCKQMVRMKPGAPAGTIRDTDIHRVDLTVIGPNGRPIWPIPVPINVVNGTCPPDEGTRTFFLSYPGRLAGWQFHRSTIQKAGDLYRRQISFEPSEGADVDLNDFPFELACNAVLNDPSVQTVQAAYDRQQVNIEVDPNSVAIIALQGGAKGVFIGDIFTVTDGKCIRQP